ncbi:hypothetical protein E2C01_033460 [Portunus trituberculatus]|uniref:Uncharacterized protein n=1 Tax=Portunus trituberculatus TaxID=210409 RepID=A0A5B7F446_PORTR|nr:hypothetical protein [Portunus trituberculatus]
MQMNTKSKLTDAGELKSSRRCRNQLPGGSDNMVTCIPVCLSVCLSVLHNKLKTTTSLIQKSIPYNSPRPMHQCPCLSVLFTPLSPRHLPRHYTKSPCVGDVIWVLRQFPRRQSLSCTCLSQCSPPPCVTWPCTCPASPVHVPVLWCVRLPPVFVSMEEEEEEEEEEEDCVC